MKNKRRFFSISVILILIMCISIVIVIMARSNNDIASMEKMILKQIRTNKTVMVYNSIVIDDYRLASYILKDAQKYQEVGYALFRINKNGNYELINVIDADIITKKANDITVYEFSQLKAGDFSITTKIFIISNNPQLAKIERIMDNGEIQAIEVITNPSISFFEDSDGDIKAKYNLYDKSGDIIK